MSKTISVGMGEMALSADPATSLVCLGLGSCIAICVYEPRRHIGAMLHVVLPTSKSSEKALPAKYADTAIPALLEALLKAGVRRSDVRVVLCGGAAIFAPLSSVMDIGQRNLTAVRAGLMQAGVRVVAEEVGGRDSRTVSLDLATGTVRLRTIRTGEFVLAELGEQRG